MPKAGVRAAVWLAMESLPILPGVYYRGLTKRAFFHAKMKLSMQWPIWTEPRSSFAISDAFVTNARNGKERGVEGEGRSGCLFE